MKAQPATARHLVSALTCAALLVLATGCQSTGSTTSRTEREPTPVADTTLTFAGWLLYMFAGF